MTDDGPHISQIIFAVGFGLLLPLLLSSFTNKSTADETLAVDEVETKPSSSHEREEAKLKRKSKLKPLVIPSDLLELMKSRRSIFPKDYSGEVVSKSNLDMMLEAANWVLITT
jgi:hypothetical protein